MAKKTAARGKHVVPGKSEGNKYDKILKEGLSESIPGLMRVVLKLDAHRMENLPEIRVQTTAEVEPDYGKMIYSDEHPAGAVFILELEAKDEKMTDDNMLYLVSAERKKHKKPVDLRMIYLLPGHPKHIKGKVQFCGLNFEYPVYAIEDYSYQSFLSSDKPEEVVLSILANREELSGAEIVDLIVERLIALRGQKRELNKFIKQLKVLSILRKLHDETIKKVKNMEASKEFVAAIRNDSVFIMGMEEGMEKGLEKGMEEGEYRKNIIGIRNMTYKKFEGDVIAELLAVPVSLVLDVQKQLKKEPEITAALQRPRASVATIAKRMKVSQMLVQVIKDTSKK
ncbi:MAG: hypothetical protein MUC59_11065 [Saprospiraceae bacterium]|jgi:hypothetical protein|nr:hypothetical protein [Saprospiraceae bacterium]